MLRLFYIVFQLILISVSHALEFSLPGGTGISFQNGIIRIKQTGGSSAEDTNYRIPPLGTPALSFSVAVKDTGSTAKGFGAFATTHLEKGTFLGFYEGNVVATRDALDLILDERERQLQQRDDKSRKFSISNAMDYVMALDGGMTFLDGYERAMDRSSFSPVHLNHADKGSVGCNCVRLLEAIETEDIDDGSNNKNGGVPYCVAFFTSRDIESGEELCFDYGANFWRGREEQKL